MDLPNLINLALILPWILLVLPRAFRHGSKGVIVASTLVVLVLEIIYCLNYASREFPFDVLAAFGITAFALAAGYFVYRFEDWNEARKAGHHKQAGE